MEYKLTSTKTGRPKGEEELTPARRYSFLVGENEPNHTAQQQLYPLLLDDERNPTLTDLENAFNIEKVTKEFFKKYKELYLELKDNLEKIIAKDTNVKEEFSTKKVDIIEFSKKLLGQIVFLYFLQKKGWLGVPPEKPWGEGDKSFLRSLFKRCVEEGNNFFNDYLEVLFYDTLNNPRKNQLDSSFSRYFDCKIPFLNGGLFEPINDYDWRHTHIILPNKLFSNQNKSEEGDLGTGILDVFDRYNFTVKEDEPLDKEVAIDPEMLGKVFENMLEVKERKSKGSYYTPREIVHYMCQESLINYLDAEINVKPKSLSKKEAVQMKLMGEQQPVQEILIVSEYATVIPKKDIEEFVRYGEFAIEHDTAKEEGTTSYKHKLHECIRENAELIDEKLENIRICDPAVGSGAFLVGMMTEIMKARNTLTTYLKSRKTGDDRRTKYYFKWNAIQNCLYGVDIDPSAVDIAKLRLWLSLVVDEENINQINTLPNLDYKIVCGDSLLGYPFMPRQLENIEKLKEEFFDKTSPQEKLELRKKINLSIRKLFEGSERSLGYKVNFDFKINFSEVFHKKGGFDVVIANPPYVEHKKLKSVSHLFKGQYLTYSGTTDLYVYFYERGLDLLRSKGVLTFISSNKFTKTSYGAGLRYLLAQQKIQQIIDFTKIHIFEALVASCILIASKDKCNKELIFSSADDTIADFIDLSDFIRKHQIKIKSKGLNQEIWQLEDTKKLILKSKIEEGSKNLGDLETINIFRGVTTGCNEAFVIDNSLRIKLIKENMKNIEVVKPLLQGRHIKKWTYQSDNEFLLFIHWHFPLHTDTEISGASKKAEQEFKSKYPSIYKHLLSFKEHLENRNREETGKRYEWYSLQRCAASYYPEFEKEKVIWGLTADKWAFAYDNKGHYLPSNGYILTSVEIPIKYLLALMNSKLMEFYFHFIGIMTAGGAYTLKHETIGAFPIKEIPLSDQQPFVTLVDRILAITKDEDYLQNPEKQAKVKAREREIDQLVYKLYGLTEEEIRIVEGETKR
jgi:hypothetical protein